MSVWYPPSNCPHCHGPVMVRIAQVVEGKVTSWREGTCIFPNYSSGDEYEVYDAAWCTDCQTSFHVEGR